MFIFCSAQAHLQGKEKLKVVEVMIGGTKRICSGCCRVVGIVAEGVESWKMGAGISVRRERRSFDLAIATSTAYGLDCTRGGELLITQPGRSMNGGLPNTFHTMTQVAFSGCLLTHNQARF